MSASATERPPGSDLLEGLAVRRADEGLLVGVRVSPGAKVTRLQGVYGDRLKVRVAAPPVGGRANNELVAAVAGWLDVPTDYVVLRSGHNQKDKVLLIRRVDERALRAALDLVLSDVAR